MWILRKIINLLITFRYENWTKKEERTYLPSSRLVDMKQYRLTESTYYVDSVNPYCFIFTSLSSLEDYAAKVSWMFYTSPWWGWETLSMLAYQAPISNLTARRGLGWQLPWTHWFSQNQLSGGLLIRIKLQWIINSVDKHIIMMHGM